MEQEDSMQSGFSIQREEHEIAQSTLINANQSSKDQDRRQFIDKQVALVICGRQAEEIVLVRDHLKRKH